MAKKDKKVEAEKVEATQPAQETPAPDNTDTVQGLQLSDLQTMMQIIDVVTQRGAIKADEMGTVGAVYNKLRLFVGQTTQAAPEVPATEEADSAKD